MRGSEANNYKNFTLAQPNFFNYIFIWPILNLLVALYQGLTLLHIPYALGFAIILLTIVIRLILYPFTASQLKASKKMQALTPHLSKLKEKHKNDAKQLQSETMRLYKEHGVNPAAGCLPVLIQFPVIIALYTVLQQVVVLNSTKAVEQINKILYIPSLKLHGIWDQHFFGIPLGQSPGQLLPALGLLILLFPIATGFLQFIQSKMMFAQQPQPVPSEKKESKEEKKPDDFATAFQTQSLYIFPIMIGFFSFQFPIGLSLYWNTFTIFGIIQQYRIQGWGGMQPYVDRYIKRKN